MTINSLRDLSKLMRMCQEHGIVYLKVDNIELKCHINVSARRNDLDAFPEANIPVPQYSPVNVQETANAVIEAIDMPDELSPEQLMFFSAKGEPQ